MASVDKVKISDTTYDVSPSATGTLNGYTSGDSTSPSSWSSVDVVSTSDTNSSIFNKITTMVQNVRWLYAKLGNDDFSDTGSDTITGALSTLQSGLDDKSPVSHTHTTMTLPVSSNQVNSENYVPTSALLYSMVQRANTVSDNVTAANEIINGGGTSEPSIGIGTTWTYTSDGTFTVPKTGTYQVEIHGGGGGGGAKDIRTGQSSGKTRGGGGGGSGEIYEIELISGDQYAVIVGAGGSHGILAGDTNIDGSDGEESRFGDFTCPGGGGGQNGKSNSDTPSDNYGTVGLGGYASGSLATAGNKGNAGASATIGSAIGGYGNKNNTSQLYGNGGNGEDCWGNGSIQDGQNGAVIITLMGVS